MRTYTCLYFSLYLLDISECENSDNISAFSAHGSAASVSCYGVSAYFPAQENFFSSEEALLNVLA